MPGIYGTGGFFEGFCWSPGVPAFNQLKIGTTPTTGNTVTINDGTNEDVYEFRNSSPPAGGTVGNTWVYDGGSAANARANLIKAINGTADVNAVTPKAGGNDCAMFAVATDDNHILVFTAVASGGAPAAWPNGTAINCTETLAAAADVWDSFTMLPGMSPGLARTSINLIQITANMISKGSVEIPIMFPNALAVLTNMNRPQNEAWYINGYTDYTKVVLNLAGGASPNNQNGDYIIVFAIETTT